MIDPFEAVAMETLRMKGLFPWLRRHDTDIARQTLTDAADALAARASSTYDIGNGRVTKVYLTAIRSAVSWLRERAGDLAGPPTSSEPPRTPKFEVRPDIDAMERGEAPALGQPHGQTGNNP